MSVKKAKIGQKITTTKDYEIQGYFSEDKILVKKGDSGFIDGTGNVHYLTGNARGKIQGFKDIEIKGYDTENIARLVYRQIEEYGIAEFLDDNDIGEDRVINDIDFILSEIL